VVATIVEDYNRGYERTTGETAKEKECNGSYKVV